MMILKFAFVLALLIAEPGFSLYEE